jgi:hypothetical protein
VRYAVICQTPVVAFQRGYIPYPEGTAAIMNADADP